MLNNVVLVGRLTDNPQLVNTESGAAVTSVVVAVQRTYKNAEGIYDTDFVKCILWNNMASNTAEYCRKGDIVGIKGRIQINNYETEEGLKRQSTEVIAEKITFLTAKGSRMKKENLSGKNKKNE